MKVVVIVILVVIAIILFRVLRSSPKSKAGSANAAKKASAARVARATRAAGSAVRPDEKHFRAVSIHCGPDACEVALAQENRRVLVGQMGTLPLPGCDAPHCQCKFEHHDDRREHEGDKRAPTALQSQLYAASGKPERRSRRGRRKDDFK